VQLPLHALYCGSLQLLDPLLIFDDSNPHAEPWRQAVARPALERPLHELHRRSLSGLDALFFLDRVQPPFKARAK
jgi:hypothetical protein